YHTKQIQLLDSLKSLENFSAVEELNTKYALQEKNDSLLIQSLEIATKEAENEQIRLKNQRRGTILIISLVTGSLLLILAITLIFSRRKIAEKNKENELLLGEIHHRVK